DQAVFAGPGFALVTVDQNVLGLVGLFGYKGPFHAGREAGAAASAEVGSLDFVDDVVRLHLQRLLDSLVAIKLQMAIDVGSAFAKALRDNVDFGGMEDKIGH